MPNIWECFSRKTATFMIMGDRCTRNVGLCSVNHGPNRFPDPEESLQDCRNGSDLNLDYVVITQLPKTIFLTVAPPSFRTVKEIRRKVPNALIELLITTFGE